MTSVKTVGPHFFVEPVDGSTATLEGGDARHLARVLRGRPGDPVSLADGSGRRWQGRITAVDRDTVTVALMTEVPTRVPRPLMTVVHALPRHRKLDEVVQRLTELGVDRIVPAAGDRSQVSLDAARAERAVARWRAVAAAAAKQSRRTVLPVIEPVVDWSGAFAERGSGVVLWEESVRPLREALDSLAPSSAVVVAVGPEGGLTRAEVEASGLVDASLGETVLRTETAALVACSAVRYHFGLLG